MPKGLTAVLVQPGKPLELETLPTPEIDPGGILIRNTAAAICGSDLHYWRNDGNYQGPDIRRVPGHEFTGVEGLDMVRINGTYVDIGNIVPQTVTLPATKIISQQIRWLGLMHYNPWIIPAALDLLVRTKDKYPLSRVVSHSFPLAEVNKAFEFAEWQGKGAGTAATRVILKP
jgi:threonine dehydrogenase-like Zn-dependent dehydrogenase